MLNDPRESRIYILLCYSASSVGALRPIAGVDVDVFLGEIASPHARFSFAGVEVDDDGDVFLEHFLVCHDFIEGMLAPSAANLDACQPDIHALEIELHSGPARSGKDAPPIGIGAGKGGFHQRRIGDGARDLVGGPVRGGAAHFNFDYALRAFAIRDDCECERFAHRVKRLEKLFVICARR